MRSVVLASAAALFSLMSAVAQTPAPLPPPRASIIGRPDWARLPTGDDLARYYPERAQRLGVGGKATIDCMVNAEGLLYDCAIVSETPPDAEFGAAALRMAKLFRLRPKTRDGLPVDGGYIRVPIVFSPPPPEEDTTPLVVTNLAKSLPLDGEYVGIFPSDKSTSEPLLPYIRLPDAPDQRKTIEVRIFTVARSTMYSQRGLYGFTDARIAFDCVKRRMRLVSTTYFDPRGQMLGTDPGPAKWTTLRKAEGRAGWNFRAMTVACSGSVGSWPLRGGIEAVIRAVHNGEGPTPALRPTTPLYIPPGPPPAN